MLADDTVQDKWLVEPDSVLGELLPAAACALRNEDAALAKAFAAAPTQGRDRNAGLLYWVFETTLVYEIFKRWLPLAEVEWEYSYPAPHHAEKADLVVFNKGTPSLLFEAKWWMSNQRKALDALRGDIEKMGKWDGLAGRYLLTFWHSPNTDDDRVRDLREVREFCAERDQTVSPVYLARFTTDHASTRKSSGCYFAMGVLSVTKS